MWYNYLWWSSDATSSIRRSHHHIPAILASTIYIKSLFRLAIISLTRDTYTSPVCVLVTYLYTLFTQLISFISRLAVLTSSISEQSLLIITFIICTSPFVHVPVCIWLTVSCNRYTSCLILTLFLASWTGITLTILLQTLISIAYIFRACENTFNDL